MIMSKNIEQMLAEHGMCVTGITGVSMRPMLHQETDRVLLVRPTSSLRPDMVALYWRGGQYVLHRVIREENGIYLIRGDNCAAGEWVDGEQILGVLDGFWRGNTYHDCTGTENAAFAAKARKTLPLRRIKSMLAALVNR